jgi:hypothetical protein
MALKQALDVLRYYDGKSSTIVGLRTLHILMQDDSYSEEQRGATEDMMITSHHIQLGKLPWRLTDWNVTSS